MGSTNFVKSLWLPDIQIFKCKQFKKRQTVTDVAGKNLEYHIKVLNVFLSIEISNFLYLFNEQKSWFSLLNFKRSKFSHGEQGLSV